MTAEKQARTTGTYGDESYESVGVLVPNGVFSQNAVHAALEDTDALRHIDTPRFGKLNDSLPASFPASIRLLLDVLVPLAFIDCLDIQATDNWE